MPISSKETRINLGDDLKAIIISLSEGNPGAISVNSRGF